MYMDTYQPLKVPGEEGEHISIRSLQNEHKKVIALSLTLQAFTLCLSLVTLDYGFSFSTQFKALVAFNLVMIVCYKFGCHRCFFQASIIVFPLLSFLIISQIGTLVNEDNEAK